ncbi:JmjC domain protein, putative [Talaromyces stipitatus ATCC 10500]|uniref:JmjC domain protein, putative n=1 Tax=Talaromyces stipitatus (strain ATCC 10500 / CBS 375.48 / QM 6759 / NRRL 1006) TaxID=441959 RepID=B8LUF2_TALSN|nr:JmjC domain protein, putative [Talaromyces stipitatus ATCC 10500]EED23725.1 JmjC domain protein, putative [Talaromyces stipitatus ATCC 10500]
MRPIRIYRLSSKRVKHSRDTHSRISTHFRNFHHSTNLPSIKWIPPNTIPDENDINHFRQHYFQVEKPVVIRAAKFVREDLPGYKKWFTAGGKEDDNSHLQLNYKYLSRFGDAVVPLEMTTTTSSSNGEDNGEVQFQRINAPLSMFLEWMQLSAQHETPAAATKTQIYLAQAYISDLPNLLSQDFSPPPRLVTETGRNDIYAANLWIGASPTYTPLHRDPNPNLFVHLAGLKRARMLNPGDGRGVFVDVRSRVENEHRLESSGSSSIRGEEMMMGVERRLLEDIIWQQHSKESSTQSDGNGMVGYDVLLERGDALFIPKGWWHSLKGVGKGNTASVNWWFR